MAEEYNGFIVLRVGAARFLPLLERGKDLGVLAREAGALELSRVLEDYPNCTTEPLVSSVAPSRLLEIEKVARDRGIRELPSLALYWRLDARKTHDHATLLERLARAADVEHVYQQLRVLDPAVNPADDTFSNQQLYLDAAPRGIDARWAWGQVNGAGESVAFVDLEQGWTLAHEDFPSIFALPGVVRDINPGHESHGTGVLGIVAGADNDRGIVGIAPHAPRVSVASHYRASNATEGHVADAIAAILASGQLAEGDVLLLEVQDGNNRPIETDHSVFIAIGNAIAMNIIVVEAAGNGNLDLDTVGALNVNAREFTDSGAIVVGAGMSSLDPTRTGHDRWLLTPSPPPPFPQPGSNYGSRVDCYGYGENVVTTGPAVHSASALGPGTSATDQYRGDFGGTSAAAAIVAGAAIVLQGLYRSVTGGSLTPAQMRHVFRTIGTPQVGATSEHIGLMPDLKAAALSLFSGSSSSGRPPAAPGGVRIVP